MNEKYLIGDIVIFQRTFYKHYGLYIGENKIIHRDNINLMNKFKSKVKINNIDDIPGKQKNGNYIYDRERLPIDKTLKMAYSHLNETGKYDIFTNNCEHFVTMVCYGKKESKQIKNLINIIQFTTILGLLFIKKPL